MQATTSPKPASVDTPGERETATSGKSPLQLDYVDGIRGLLTLAVLLAHVRTTLIYIPLHTVNFALFAVSTVWMWPAFYSVGMFVAISGYCLMLPVARSQDGWFRGGISDYLRRRTRRMLPPYYAALVLSLILARLTMQNHYMMYSKAWTRESLASHMMMVHNLFLKYRYSIDAPCWTVAAEWQLYLLFPLVLLPIWRRFGIPALLGVSAALSLLPFLCGADAVNYHSWYIFIFALGMCGAAIQYHDRLQEKRWRKNISWSKIALWLYAAFGLLCIADFALHNHLIWEYIPNWKRFCGYELLAGTACVALMVYGGQRLHEATDRHPSMVIRFLSHPWLTLIGMFSYSHYLVHFPILFTIRWLTLLMRMPSTYVIFIMYFVAIPISLTAGYLFFLLVEKRFLPSHLRK